MDKRRKKKAAKAHHVVGAYGQPYASPMTPSSRRGCSSPTWAAPSPLQQQHFDEGGDPTAEMLDDWALASTVSPLPTRPGARMSVIKRREMGWNTSFPAEYHHSHTQRDYEQTLAYQEQLQQRQQLEMETMSGTLAGVSLGPASPTRAHAQAAQSPSEPSTEELDLLKEVTVREGLLAKLRELAVVATTRGSSLTTEQGTELLHLLLQLREASVNVVAAIARWHQSLRSRRLPAFIFENQNYCVKMVSDLNFLASIRTLGDVLGVDPARMKQNPFMMPAPIPDRDFHEMQSTSQSPPPRFTFSDSTQRVAEAEKYLVWCLVNARESGETLPPQQASRSSHLANNNTGGRASSPSSPQRGAGGAGAELRTWQQRAEQQLRVLSMPLASASGSTHVQDSSRMMKRKGYLPSLPRSPPKTLTQLLAHVHKTSNTSPTTRASCFSAFTASHEGITYRTTALDLEVLGSNEAPPHAMVTLVGASVLILLSPSDRIPKDLAWPSCQKMLRDGMRLLERISTVDVAGIPPFKWKALVPFLQNERFHPMFLLEYSSAAAALCAWILDVLDKAQHQENYETKAEDDRRDLLDELEQEEELEATQVPLPSRPSTSESRASLSRSQSGKRVSIGNAEVLFINENEPVSPPSTASLAADSASRRSVLLRTSPWTHRGVTYFVSFFLVREEHEGAGRETLSIKMYEPMSSVESQMFVSPDDLEMDFGPHAREYFRRREFGLVCDLILGQLESMLSQKAQTDKSPVGASEVEDDDDNGPQRDAGDDEGGTTASTATEREAAIVRIQCLARQSHAKKRVHGLREERARQDEATVAIQCAIRQHHARKKVHHVRFSRAKAREELHATSATQIQSLARQRLAKKRVAQIRLQRRTPTGLPPAALRAAMMAEDEDEDAAYDDEQAASEATQAMLRSVMPPEKDVDVGPETDDPEEVAVPPPAEHMAPVGSAGRPETSMSYASEQFEDEFEEE